MNDPKTKTVDEIFGTKNQLTVPRYQRGYDWKYDKQVAELFSDITACLDARGKKTLFLGTSILDISQVDNDSIEIIDGQQRTTTLQILLIAMRSYAKFDLKNEELVDYIHEYIVWKKPFPGKPQRNRLEPSTTIKNIFSYMAKKNWKGDFPNKLKLEGKDRESGIKLENNRARPVYNALYESVRKYCEKDPMGAFEKLCGQVIEDTYIIQIEIEDKTEAFEIFERTNARGKGLEISDLLKNYLFSKYKMNEISKVERLWKKITKNAGSSMLRMLKYFWISRHGFITKKDLYTEIKSYAEKKKISIFTSELLEFSEFYAAFNSKNRGDFKKWIENKSSFPKNNMYVDEAVRVRNAFRLFGITQLIPLFYASLQNFSQNKTLHAKTRQYINFLRYLEAYHFINNKVCKRVGNEVEKLYAEYSERFSTTDDFFDCVEDLKKLLNKRLAKRSEFLSAFENITYGEKKERPFIRYVFDRLVNVGLRQGNREPLFGYFDKRPNYDIDHLLCQKEAKQKVSEETMNEMGNLLVIPNQINSILNDDPFDLKLKKFLNPGKYGGKIKRTPDYVKSFAEKYIESSVWSDKDIQSRTKTLAIEAYESATQKLNY